MKESTIWWTFIGIHFIVCLIFYFPVKDGKTIYTSNKKKFVNYTLGDMLLSLVFFPVELISVLFNSPKGLSNFLAKRPFKKFKFKVGDKVKCKGLVYQVYDVQYNESFEEILRLTNKGQFYLDLWEKSEDVELLTPLENLL